MQSTRTLKETLEELRVTLDDAAKKDIGDTYREKLDPKTTAELFAGVTKRIYDVAHETEETAAEYYSMDSSMRLFLAVREVYVMGVLDGMDAIAQATGERIDELTQES